MNPLNHLAALAELYVGEDPTFATVIEKLGIDTQDNAALADAIELDGRQRLQRAMPVLLERYGCEITDIARRPEPLDAAIDMALRGITRTRVIDDAAIDELASAWPELETAIRDTAALNNVMWSTVGGGSAAHTAGPLELPHTLTASHGVGAYELIEWLGAGAVGTVYRAIDRSRSDEIATVEVAVKVLQGTPDADRRRTLGDEATKARQVEHRNVARVLDRGETAAGEAFVVYELISGGDLLHWRRQQAGPVSLRAAASIVARIARGVQGAHRAGLVHCDLKPNNVLLTEQGEPKVADFGTAVRDGDDRSTAGAELRGTLAFMSPEQFALEPGALTIPTDVYALGGVLYWLLTDELPNGAAPQEIERTHTAGSGVAPPMQHRPDIPFDLDRICARALERDSAARHASAAAFAHDLEDWLAWRPIEWLSPSRWKRIRLSARRAPVRVAALLILSLLVISALPVAWTWSIAAASEASVRGGRVANRDRLTAQLDDKLYWVAPQIWLTRPLLETTHFGRTDDQYEVLRLQNVAALYAHAGSRGASFEEASWATALGFLQLQKGQPDLALVSLTAAAAVIQKGPRPDTVLLGDVDALLSLARIRAGTGTPADYTTIEARARDLEQRDLAGGPIAAEIRHTLEMKP